MLKQISNVAWRTNILCDCASFSGEKFGSICMGCANGSLPFFTAWISLGDYQNCAHTLLEFVQGSHHDRMSEKQMGEQFPKCREKYIWQFPSSNGMQHGDMLIFNCKTLHRALAKLDQLGNTFRCSIDMRFTIVHTHTHANTNTHTNICTRTDADTHRSTQSENTHTHTHTYTHTPTNTKTPNTSR